MKYVTTAVTQTKKGFRSIGARIVRVIDRWPLVVFFTFLALLFVLIMVSNFLRKPPEPVKEARVAKKTVDVYRIGSAPKVGLQAQIEKTGVIVITAQTSGVVQKIYHQEGANVKRGDWLVGLSTNYQGGNVFSLQRSIAQKQLQNAEEALPIQKDLIGKQRELAEKTDVNADELRKITARSIDETKSALNLNGDILATIDKNLQQYVATNSAGQNEALILSTKQLKSQYLAANNQLQSALRNAEYSSGDDNAPAALSNISKDIALKQLDLQEKSIELGTEINRLQVKIAQVNEGLMYPGSPFAASVQRVHVRVGQAVTPGTPLVTIDCAHGGELKAVVLAPKEIVDKVSYIEPSVLHIGNFNYTSHPGFISKEATHGNLYSVIYDIPQEFQDKVTDKGYISVDLPVGYFDTGSVMPFIPLDSIYQTNDKAFVFVEEKGKATSEEVTLGGVYGRFAEVTSGLSAGKAVILNRTVIEGDPVIVSN